MFNLNILLNILIIINIYFSTIITIPFKILEYDSPKNQILEKTVEDMVFYFKLLSIIDIGNPPQKIEAMFDLKSSKFYISNSCRNCSTFYSYKNSNSFNKINTDIKPLGFGNQIYANESFIFYDGINSRQKRVENMLIYLPELDEEDLQNINKNRNCLNIGIKFPDYNNNFQKSFVQQLKTKNIINQYFWTMTFYDNKYNKDYDGAFIFGDILNDYYPKIYNDDYSLNKIVKTYTGNKKLKNNVNKNSILEWGLEFDEIYYELTNSDGNNHVNNIVYIHKTMIDFNLNFNVILGTFEYYRSIQNDFFNYYFDKNICKCSYMRGSLYKFIYCHYSNFTQKDLEKFPSLKLKNRILRFIFNLDYKDLFSLTYDKKYYIFNIMAINVYQGDKDDGGEWVFGLPFLKKYQFSFDTDNKLIYFYNKEGNFLDEIPDDEIDYDDYDDGSNKVSDTTETLSDEIENDGNDTEITNNQRIIKKNKKRKKYVDIKIQKIILFIILVIIFLFLFFVLLLLIKKILFKKGFVLIRIKKANELDDDFDYSSNKNNKLLIKENNSKNQECEMQIKFENK